MKLYDAALPAPNPRRVRIFLAEKGIEVPRVRLSIPRREHKGPAFMALNSLGQVPALELDDGTVVAESVAICRYFEALHPDPPLFGAGAVEQAKVEMWSRRVEFQIMAPLSQIWRHGHPLTASLLNQIPEAADAGRTAYARALVWLDREIGDAFLAGERLSMADISALCTLDFADFVGVEPPQELARLAAWRARVSERPSTAA